MRIIFVLVPFCVRLLGLSCRKQFDELCSRDLKVEVEDAFGIFFRDPLHVRAVVAVDIRAVFCDRLCPGS